MSPRISSAIACYCLLAPISPVVCFAPPSSSRTSSQRARSSSLQMAAITAPSEELYPRLLTNAHMCANSDACSIDEAEMYLKEIVHFESGCAAGTLSGGVCDDVVEVSEVVAELRQKIAEGAKAEVKTFWDKRQEELLSLTSAISTPNGATVSSTLTAPLKPGYLALAALYTVMIVSMFHPATMHVSAGGTVPFTAQEVWWSIRDGYVGDLASHAFRNWGLLVADPVEAVASVGNALTPQELMWSVRDGYAADTLFNGGAEGGVESVPFTPQETWWAIQNGYANNMVSHWFRNGGLSM